MSELTDALALANTILDRPSADPDDDLAMLARQLIRQHETVARIKQWLLDRSIEHPIRNGQVLLWELTHIVDGLPLPMIPKTKEPLP